MKKTMTRNIVIMAIVTVIMAVVLSLYIKNTGTVPAADNTASLADGTYTASEQGCLSEVAVTVTVTGGKVTNVAIDASGETPELGGAAAETLADELTKAGSTAGVDAVSGATLTSNAVFTAMDSCLAQAGTGSAGAEDLTDGTYTSSAKGCLSDVNVTVTVSGGKVSEVAIDASGETPELGGAAAETLADALTKAGSTNGVDAVSGATYSSTGILNAVKLALAKAAVAPAEEAAPEQAASEEAAEEAAAPSEVPGPDEMPVAAPTVEVVQPEEKSVVPAWLKEIWQQLFPADAPASSEPEPASSEEVLPASEAVLPSEETEAEPETEGAAE